MKTVIGGIGCFWDETKYEGIEGIISTECGYCGGDDPNITYKAVCGGDTGHIEVVKVQYDEKEKSEFLHSIDAVKKLWEAASKIDPDLTK